MSINKETLFAAVESLYERYLDVWEDICNIESPSRYKEGIDACSAYLVKLAEEYGWKVERRAFEEAGDAVCITMNGDVDARPISFSGHLDTVHPLGSFGTPACRRDEKNLYGPGVTDCKGGVVVGLLAMAALDKCGWRGRPVQMILQTDEEVGSRLSKRGTIEFMAEKSRDAVAFLNLEGGSKGEICVQRKGIHTFTFHVHGQEAHSSQCASHGANAIIEAAHKMLEIDAIEKDEPNGLTCCCSIVSGGTVPNTVPGECTFKVNVRFANEEQRLWIVNKMQEIAAKNYNPGCTTEVTFGRGRVAMERHPRNLALLDTINGILARNGMETLTGFMRYGGSDAADMTVAGIPALDNFGVWGEKIHSPEEYGELRSLAEMAKVLAIVAVEIEG